MASHLYLVKDSNELISHCKCAAALIAAPGQVSCPWCGCGWMFSCVECRKAFTFARAVETDVPWEALALRDLTRFSKKEPSDEEIDGWVEAMRELHADVELGARYVYLDGMYVPTDATSVSFTGWHTTHILDFVPQVAALADPGRIRSILMNPDYWVGGGTDEESEPPSERVILH
jgi:hypothetical protein